MVPSSRGELGSGRRGGHDVARGQGHLVEGLNLGKAERQHAVGRIEPVDEVRGERGDLGQRQVGQVLAGVGQGDHVLGREADLADQGAILVDRQRQHVVGRIDPVDAGRRRGDQLGRGQRGEVGAGVGQGDDVGRGQGDRAQLAELRHREGQDAVGRIEHVDAGRRQRADLRRRIELQARAGIGQNHVQLVGDRAEPGELRHAHPDGAGRPDQVDGLDAGKRGEKSREVDVAARHHIERVGSVRQEEGVDPGELLDVHRERVVARPAEDLNDLDVEDLRLRLGGGIDHAVHLQLDRVGAGAAVERVEQHELVGRQRDRIGGVAADEMLDAGHRGPREVDDGRRPEQAERIVAAPAVDDVIDRGAADVDPVVVFAAEQRLDPGSDALDIQRVVAGTAGRGAGAIGPELQRVVAAVAVQNIVASVAEGGVVEFGAVEGLTGGGAGKVCHVPVPQVGSRHTDEAAKAARISVGF